MSLSGESRGDGGRLSVTMSVPEDLRRESLSSSSLPLLLESLNRGEIASSSNFSFSGVPSLRDPRLGGGSNEVIPALFTSGSKGRGILGSMRGGGGVGGDINKKLGSFCNDESTIGSPIGVGGNEVSENS